VTGAQGATGAVGPTGGADWGAAMTVVTLGATGASATATAADAGKMFVMTGAETLVFDDLEDLTGRRFEFFNTTNTDLLIQFDNSTQVNGAISNITVPAQSHAVVMGIANGEYIAWIDTPTDYIPPPA
jgi:hypothetical protein